MRMDERKLKKTGTTTITIKCKDGIIMAADKRATAGHFIANKKVEKVFPISDNIAITIAGLVSDAQLLTKYIKAEIKLREIKTGRQITVSEVANLLAGMSYSNIRNFSAVPGIVGFLVGGEDVNGFSSYEIGIDGSLTEIDEYASDGSGSLFAYAVLEDKYHKDLSLKEAEDLAVNGLEIAQRRDSASGNGYDVVRIAGKGVEKVASYQYDVKFKH